MRTTVSDSGIGINPAHMHQLFQPFERLGADQRAIDGTGLGLALSKGLIEVMGGSIEASSEVGVGSSFAIELAGVLAPHADDCRPEEHAGGTRELPVIVLTVDASKGVGKRLVLLGASEFMQKPLDVPRFLDVIEAYVG